MMLDFIVPSQFGGYAQIVATNGTYLLIVTGDAQTVDPSKFTMT
jgi:hypothetical protein